MIEKNTKKSVMSLIKKFNTHWLIDSSNEGFNEAIEELKKKGLINKGMDQRFKELTKDELKAQGGKASFPNFDKKKLGNIGITNEMLQKLEYFG